MYSSPVNSFTLATHKIAVVLLAAGRGSRMESPTPKLLLPMPDGKPLLLHALENALNLHPLDLIVVVQPDLLPVIQSETSPFHISGYANNHIHNPSQFGLSKWKSVRSAIRTRNPFITYIPNPRYEEGMGTSLALGVTTLSVLSPQAEACLVLLGDEPAVPLTTVQRLVEAYSLSHPAITIPIYGSQPGPPTIFSHDLFPDLALLQGDTGGRQLLTKFPDKVVRVLFQQDERPKDVDTLEDYQSLK